MYLHAFVLFCGICLISAATFIPSGPSGKETSLKNSEMPCTFPSLPMNSRRRCDSDYCTVSCLGGYKFPDERNSVSEMRCIAGTWQPTIPNCIPVCSLPCLNGGVCGAPNTCFCPTAYKGAQCQDSNCDHGCLNGGTCIGKNICQCRNNFVGNLCEMKNECYWTPDLPKNASRMCSSVKNCTVVDPSLTSLNELPGLLNVIPRPHRRKPYLRWRRIGRGNVLFKCVSAAVDYRSCTVTCNDGYKFPDGSTNAAVHCVDGEWKPSSTPDCVKE